MYNGGKIIIGLIIFVGLVTYPLWNNMGKATVKPDPKIDTPEILKLPEIDRKCIESKDIHAKRAYEVVERMEG